MTFVSTIEHWWGRETERTRKEKMVALQTSMVIPFGLGLLRIAGQMPGLLDLELPKQWDTLHGDQ